MFTPQWKFFLRVGKVLLILTNQQGFSTKWEDGKNEVLFLFWGGAGESRNEKAGDNHCWKPDGEFMNSLEVSLSRSPLLILSSWLLRSLTLVVDQKE